MIRFRCDACGKKIGAPEKYAGRQVACPVCKKPATVPAEVEAEAIAPEDDPLMPDLDELEPASQPGPAVATAAPVTTAPDGRSCPNCQKPVADSAVLCVGCGQPLKKGMRRQKTTVGSAERGERGRVMARSAAGLVVAGIVAVVFSMVWVGIIVVTGYEAGVVAWAMGGLIGLVAGAIARNPSPIFGGLTATLAIGSILIAKLIVVGLVLLASFGLNMARDLASYTPEQQKIHHAVLDEMIAEGAFAGDQLAAANLQVASYFTEAGLDEEAITDWETHIEASTAVDEAVTERLATMSEQEQEAAVERARERHPGWIEDHMLYLAVVDGMVSRSALPKDLHRHAHSELAQMTAEGWDEEYYQETAPREQERRATALRERVAEQIRGMSQVERAAAIEAARQRHPRWIADYELHHAVLDQLVREGALTGDVERVAKADVAVEMDGEWEHPVFEEIGWEKLEDLRGQATEAVNVRIGQLDEQQRADLIAAASEAHPNWRNPLGFDADEVEHALLQDGIDGSFTSALKAAFGWWDILWFGLAVTTAYSVAVKQGQKAMA